MFDEMRTSTRMDGPEAFGVSNALGDRVPSSLEAQETSSLFYQRHAVSHVFAGGLHIMDLDLLIGC